MILSDKVSLIEQGRMSVVKSILYQCKQISNFPIRSSVFDEAVTVYTDGSIVKELYNVGTTDIIASEVIAKKKGIALAVVQIFEKYKN